MTPFQRGTPESNCFALQCDSIGEVILRSTSCKYQVQSVNTGCQIEKSTAVETHNSHRYASKRGSALTGCLFFQLYMQQGHGSVDYALDFNEAFVSLFLQCKWSKCQKAFNIFKLFLQLTHRIAVIHSACRRLPQPILCGTSAKVPLLSKEKYVPQQLAVKDISVQVALPSGKVNKNLLVLPSWHN